MAVLFAGCSVSLVYGQLHRLLPWYIGDYVTLDRDQRALLDVRLAERLAWHCRTQLGPYAALLRRLEGDLRSGAITPARLDLHLGHAEVLLRDLLTAILLDARLLLVQLDDEQLDELAGAFRRRNRDMHKAFLSGTPAERRMEQIERMEKRLRSWFGRLSEEQRRLVEHWSDALQPTTAEWLANRERWQARLMATLAQRRDTALFEARLRLLLIEPDSAWSASYRARMTHNREQTLILLAGMFDTATPRQREHLFGEIGAWARQFERLACTQAPTLKAGQG
ncbi:DUF6279 family lipoprotein [Azotobacter armeniacus]